MPYNEPNVHLFVQCFTPFQKVHGFSRTSLLPQRLRVFGNSQTEEHPNDAECFHGEVNFALAQIFEHTLLNLRLARLQISFLLCIRLERLLILVIVLVVPLIQLLQVVVGPLGSPLLVNLLSRS